MSRRPPAGHGGTDTPHGVAAMGQIGELPTAMIIIRQHSQILQAAPLPRPLSFNTLPTSMPNNSDFRLRPVGPPVLHQGGGVPCPALCARNRSVGLRVSRRRAWADGGPTSGLKRRPDKKTGVISPSFAPTDASALQTLPSAG